MKPVVFPEVLAVVGPRIGPGMSDTPEYLQSLQFHLPGGQNACHQTSRTNHSLDFFADLAFTLANAVRHQRDSIAI